MCCDRTAQPGEVHRYLARRKDKTSLQRPSALQLRFPNLLRLRLGHGLIRECRDPVVIRRTGFELCQ
jgi:hypothetical protein